MKKAGRFLRDNPRITVGLALISCMLLFWLVGLATIGTSKAVPISGPPDQPPSARYLLGTDSAGRQLLPVLIAGIPLTLEIGLLAGGVGLLIGALLGFSAGYFGGPVDSVIRTAADVILPIPALAVLVVIASTIHTLLSVEIMALVIASLAWMYPTRTIRAQVLSLRNRAFVEVGRFSGETHVDIIFRELMPNLLPYLAASFVGAVGAGILAGIGLEALGLGPQDKPTLGMTIFWAIYYGATLRGMWWWWGPPIVVLILVFMSLFLIAQGLDRYANPRLRRTA
ncbi:MAG TPA: ABC transporter permease [Chloroflexota bacterium]|jgi:peptide/nickel transport system permease protein